MVLCKNIFVFKNEIKTSCLYSLIANHYYCARFFFFQSKEKVPTLLKIFSYNYLKMKIFFCTTGRKCQFLDRCTAIFWPGVQKNSIQHRTVSKESLKSHARSAVLGFASANDSMRSKTFFTCIRPCAMI